MIQNKPNIFQAKPNIIETQRWKFKSRSGLTLRKGFKSWRWAQNCSNFAEVGKCSKLKISHSGGSTTSPTSTAATSSSSTTKVFSILSCETLQSERQKNIKTRAENSGKRLVIESKLDELRLGSVSKLPPRKISSDVRNVAKDQTRAFLLKHLCLKNYSLQN